MDTAAKEQYLTGLLAHRAETKPDSAVLCLMSTVGNYITRFKTFSSLGTITFSTFKFLKVFNRTNKQGINAELDVGL